MGVKIFCGVQILCVNHILNLWSRIYMKSNKFEMHHGMVFL